MTYDHWKATNPADEFLGPDPDEDEDCLSEEAMALMEPHLSGRGYVVLNPKGEGYLREPDALSMNGTRVARFATWMDAYVTAVNALEECHKPR